VGNADPTADKRPRAITGEKLDAIIGALRAAGMSPLATRSQAPCQRRVRKLF